MALPPSRRDTIGPPPRDVSDLASIVRHQGSYLRSLDPGILGGTRATPRPVPRVASQLVGDDGGVGTADYAWENDDRLTVTALGTQTFRLTHEPVEGSLHVYWNGLNQPPTEWTLDEKTVTIPDPHGLIDVGDVFTAAYVYENGDDDLPSIEFIGITLLTDSITSIALPAGTQPGDLLILASAAWGSASTSDPRMTNSAGSLSSLGVAWGFATSDTSPVSVAVDGSAFNWAATVLAVYRGVTVVDHASLGMTGADSTLPVLSDANAAIGIVLAFNGGFVSGTLGVDTTGAWTDNGLAASANTHVRVSSWQSDTTQPTPPGAFHLTGGFGGGTTVTLKLGST